MGGTMPRRFAGIRLLLVFVAVNTVLVAMLMFAMTSEHPWLARILPGQFGAGVNSSGYWLYFALMLLINSLTVVIAGLVLVMPALRESARSDEKRMMHHLVDRGGISDESKDAVLTAFREEALAAHSQIVTGRWILLAGVVFLVLAFCSVSFTFARALPDGSLFTIGNTSVRNADVTLIDVARFTADQIAEGVLQDAPELYHWRFGVLENNTENMLFTNFVFVFRIMMVLVAVLTIVAFLRRREAPPKPKKASETVAETVL